MYTYCESLVKFLIETVLKEIFTSVANTIVKMKKGLFLLGIFASFFMLMLALGMGKNVNPVCWCGSFLFECWDIQQLTAAVQHGSIMVSDQIQIKFEFFDGLS